VSYLEAGRDLSGKAWKLLGWGRFLLGLGFWVLRYVENANEIRVVVTEDGGDEPGQLCIVAAEAKARETPRDPITPARDATLRSRHNSFRIAITIESGMVPVLEFPPSLSGRKENLLAVVPNVFSHILVAAVLMPVKGIF